MVPGASTATDAVPEATGRSGRSEPEVRAGGGVVWRTTKEGRIEVVLVHHSIYAEWTLPKGKQDPGEDLISCAVREVEEETGLRCTPGDELAAVHYVDRIGRTKAVHYWTMEAPAGSASDNPHALAPTMEIDDAKWAPLPYALSEAYLPRDRIVLWSFAGQVGLTAPELRRRNSLLRKASKKCPLLLLRHASAGDRLGFSGDDLARSLDSKGRAQSAKLAARLSAFPVERIVSSPAVRCTETVEDLAELLGLKIEIDERLGEGHGPEVAELLSTYRPGGAVLCTHGDVVEAALSYASETGGLPLPGDGTTKKASTWALNGSTSAGDAPFRVAGYLVPPAV